MNRTTKTVTELEYDKSGRVIKETKTTTETESPSVSHPFTGGWNPAPQKPSWWWQHPVTINTTDLTSVTKVATDKGAIVDGYL